MTYNEWRDELKSNLLCVTEAERRRVLDYYAEAYADRRDAGFTEREIIDEFGAPYDAAQKILYENAEDVRRDGNFDQRESNNFGGQKRASSARQDRQDPFAESEPGYNQAPPHNNSQRYAPPPPQYAPPPPPKRADYTWVFIILCIACAVPIFGVFMALAGVTLGLIAAPFGIMISGVATIGAGVGMMFSNPISGAAMLGSGLMLFGVSLVFMPLCFKLVKLMWTLFKKFFVWAKNIFSGRSQSI